MIKIEKVLADNRLLGICGDEEWYYLYKGLNTETNMYCEVIACKEDIDKNKKFEKQVRDRVKFILQDKEKKDESFVII